MVDSRKVYLNGKFVGEFTPTGDRQTDIELSVELLREKGLYQETTTEQAMFRQAISFATTSSYLYNRDLTTVPRNGLSTAPFVVNSAFALEMYLKTLGKLHNKVTRGHDLVDLFDALPPEAHEALRQNFATSNWQCGITEIAGFRKALEDMRGAFVEWRYLHEEGRAGEIRFAPMIFVMQVLHETCKAGVHCKPAGEVRQSPLGWPMAWAVTGSPPPGMEPVYASRTFEGQVAPITGYCSNNAGFAGRGSA